MVPLSALWLPILVSSALVFVASCIIHMLLPYHRNDHRKFPAEDQVMDDLRRTGVTPGDYVIPHASSSKEMSTPEYLEKLNRGPVAFISIAPSGPFNMSRMMGLWFVYILLINTLVAYVASRASGPTSDYANIFQVVGAAAIAAYAFAQWQNAIWYSRSWSTALKSTFDGVVYGLLTAGAFGWLWPTV